MEIPPPITPLPTSIVSSSHHDLRSRLTVLDEEMHTLESKLHLLRGQRRIVLQALDKIIYPILTLPPEITAHIFSHYVESPHIGGTRDRPGRSPLPLASVCRIWREICLSMPPLWSSLRIYPNQSPSESEVPGLLDLLRHWLPRAGIHPLELELFRFSTVSTATILSHLAQYSHQWRTLRLTFRPLPSFPNDKIKGGVPCLTKLSITMDIVRGDVPGAVTAFIDAPRLREVQLSGASLRWISLPWIQLTSPKFSDESISNCLEILEQTPNLEVLGVGELTRPSGGMHHLTLSRLHTLEFQYRYVREGILFDHLTLPALKTIQLSALEYDGVSRLLALGTRSQWSLKSIRLVGLPSPISNLCLAATPCVEEVEILHCASHWRPDPLDDLVALLHNESTFLPAVRVVKLRQCAVDISASSLAAMLTSRCDGSREGIAKLESFQLLFDPNAVPIESIEEIRSRLRRLREMGLYSVVGMADK